MRTRAFLFGLNYEETPGASLRGCINDVMNMKEYLEGVGIPAETFTDDVNKEETSAMGMLNKLYEIAVRSWTENLDFVWIHYSGHGTYVRDTNGDEKDGYDECLVPRDFQTIGVIPDDYINKLFSYFNPSTRVVVVFDCCHSATIGDVKYSWESPTRVAVENIMCGVRAPIVTLSGCMDTQTSADAYNVQGQFAFSGAMTSCLLMALKKYPVCANNVFSVLDKVRYELRVRGFSQIPKLCSTYNIAKNPSFLPSA
jgi:hypothetical protein